MSRLILILLSISLFISCAKTSRSGILSKQLPLTLGDLGEIRAGDANHIKIIEQYKLFPNPKLELYLNHIAASIAEISTRPHLPYKVYILDTEEVNLFGGPGGYIYITRGLLNFLDAEAELAAVIAHEISHIAHHEYDPMPEGSRRKGVYNMLLKGSEIAKDSIGTYGTAANYGIKAIGKAGPYIAKRFNNDQEIIADEAAIGYLMKAGYDPRGLGSFVKKISTVPMADINRFVIYLNMHPPFQDRQKNLYEKLAAMKLDKPGIEFKADMLSEVRQMTVNAPDSIVFEPAAGVDKLMATNAQDETKEKKTQPAAFRKPNAWF